MNNSSIPAELLAEYRLAGIASERVLSAIVILVICLIVMRVLTKLIGKMLSCSKKLDATLQGFIHSAIRIVLWLLTAIIVAEALGIPTTSVVALFSVAGLALSLSLQNILSNLFSGITLLMTKPFAAGDYVDISGRCGTIKSVGLFYTVIASLDNILISIPNADVTASTVINYNAEALRRVDMVFSASYDDPTEKVKAALLEAAEEDKRVLSDPAAFVGLKEYKASSIDYVIRLWCRNDDYWDVYFGMNERVRESFRRNGITMSYEHLNVHIKNEDK